MRFSAGCTWTNSQPEEQIARIFAAVPAALDSFETSPSGFHSPYQWHIRGDRVCGFVCSVGRLTAMIDLVQEDPPSAVIRPAFAELIDAYFVDLVKQTCSW